MVLIFLLSVITAAPAFGKGKLARPKTDEIDGGSQSQASQGGSEILRLKRRFVRDSEQARVFFIKRQSRLTELREVHNWISSLWDIYAERMRHR